MKENKTTQEKIMNCIEQYKIENQSIINAMVTVNSFKELKYLWDELELNYNAIKGLEKQLQKVQRRYVVLPRFVEHDHIGMSLEYLNTYKEKAVEFKIGDKVNSKYFEGIKTIIDIDNNRICSIKVGDTWYNKEVLTLVDELKKGQDVEVSLTGKYWHRGFGQKFHSYDPTLAKPYIVTRNDGYIENCAYCRAFTPKYRAYTDATKAYNEHENERILYKDTTYTLVGWRNKVTVLLRNPYGKCISVDLESLFQHGIFLKDDTPCGELR